MARKVSPPGAPTASPGAESSRVPLAYVVWFLETIGAVCIMLGLFTRFFAAAVAIQFVIITFVAHWAQGFGWSIRAAAGSTRCSGASSSSPSRCAAAGPIRSTASSAGSCRHARAGQAAAGLIHTLLSWKAAPPNGAIASAPVSVLMPRPSAIGGVGPDRFRDQHAAAHAVEQPGVQAHLAARVAEHRPRRRRRCRARPHRRDGSSPRAGPPWRARSASR